MDSNQKEKIMIDSCVFLKILLHEAGLEKCEEEITDIYSREDTLCVTSGIIHEVVERIEESIQEELQKLNYCVNQKESKRKREMFFNHLETLKTLTQNSRTLFLVDGKEGKEIWDECMSGKIRNNGEKRGDWDRIHLAIAISNKCSKFITTDKKIKENEKAISYISNGITKIKLL